MYIVIIYYVSNKIITYSYFEYYNFIIMIRKWLNMLEDVGHNADLYIASEEANTQHASKIRNLAIGALCIVKVRSCSCRILDYCRIIILVPCTTNLI